MKIIYSSCYSDYSFGPGHPWWPQRAEEFLKILPHSGLNYEIISPKKASDKDITLVHTADYLSRVKELARNHGFLSLDTPVSPENLEAAFLYVGGTILACDLALSGEIAFNTLGGLHHAGISDSSGFCIFCDHAIAIKKLQREKKLKKAFILDLDVHAGNGTQEIFWQDPTVFTLSIHQDPTFFYPGTGFSNQIGEGRGRGYNLNIPLPSGTDETRYLANLDKIALPKIEEFKADLLVVVFGADTFKDDPLASFQLEIATYGKIGRKLKPFTKAGIAILCAGGYSKSVPQIWLEFLKGLTL